MKILFLDDMPSRVPMVDPQDELVYVRDANEFAEWLKANGTPDVISFDHDLSEEHYDPTGGYGNPDRPASGTDAARWCVENGFVPKLVVVHSWNPDGAKRIADCFKGTCAAVHLQKFSPVSPLVSPVYRWVYDPEISG